MMAHLHLLGRQHRYPQHIVEVPQQLDSLLIIVKLMTHLHLLGRQHRYPQHLVEVPQQLDSPEQPLHLPTSRKALFYQMTIVYSRSVCF
jgi:hypothetical protein